MRLRADFRRTELVTPDQYAWVDSPQPGVRRMMLERIGDEVAVATSLVRFEPGAGFPHHEHGQGEEFLVLEGVFADEEGAYPRYSYVRHPAGTAHEPRCPDGCVILVKLRQFDATDSARCVRSLDGESTALLHEHGDETIEWLCGPQSVERAGRRGCVWEAFVVEGEVRFGERTLAAGSWLRRGLDEPLRLELAENAICYVKRRPIPAGLSAVGP